MRNHTGTVRVCQYRTHNLTPETTPLPTETLDDTVDWRLARRYGVALLTGGYTALPTYAWVYYARLGVSEAEMVLIAQLCTYWWTERAPHPGEAALAARMGKTVNSPGEGPQLPGADTAAHPTDPDGPALATEIAALSAELGDDAPASSITRAGNLRRDARLSLDRFLRLLDEAAARTRDRQTSIVKRRRDGQAPNGMPYLFAVLTDLLHPAPPHVAAVDPPPDRRRVGQPGRRRRQREGGHGEAPSSYAAWSDSPARLPITEEHPVWRAVLTDLAQIMIGENFNAWLATTRALDQEGEVLRVAVPAAFNKTWLEQKLHGKVMAALHKIDDAGLGAGRVAHIAYVVDVAACVPAAAIAQAS